MNVEVFADTVLPLLKGVNSSEFKIVISDHSDFVMESFTRLMKSIEVSDKESHDLFEQAFDKMSVAQQQAFLNLPEVQGIIYFCNNYSAVNATILLVEAMNKPKPDSYISDTHIGLYTNYNAPAIEDYMVDVLRHDNLLPKVSSDIKNKINEAYLLIRKYSPDRAEIIEELQNYCIVYESSDSAFSSSGSFRGYNGLFFMIIGKEVPVIEIASMIVHEAIHTALNIYEYSNGTLLDFSKIDGTEKIISPWTTNIISLDSYFQAIFVWYGLYLFWKNIQDRESNIDSLLVSAAKGFLSGHVTESLAQYSKHIQQPATYFISLFNKQIHHEMRAA